MLYFMRHGENKSNLEQTFSGGGSDEPLTETGVKQAEQAAVWLATRQIRRIYSSPLKRALQSAHISAERLGLEVSTSEGLREIRFGVLEGLRYDEALEPFRVTFSDWLRGNLDSSFDGGETGHEAVQRFSDFLDSLPINDDDVLIVGHGGIFALGLSALCPDVTRENTGGVVLSNTAMILMNRTQQGLSLVEWGVVEHLE